MDYDESWLRLRFAHALHARTAAPFRKRIAGLVGPVVVLFADLKQQTVDRKLQIEQLNVRLQAQPRILAQFLTLAELQRGLFRSVDAFNDCPSDSHHISR